MIKLRILRLAWIIHVGPMESHYKRVRRSDSVAGDVTKNRLQRGYKLRTAGASKLGEAWKGFSL